MALRSTRAYGHPSSRGGGNRGGTIARSAHKPLTGPCDGLGSHTNYTYTTQTQTHNTNTKHHQHHGQTFSFRDDPRGPCCVHLRATLYAVKPYRAWGPHVSGLTSLTDFEMVGKVFHETLFTRRARRSGGCGAVRRLPHRGGRAVWRSVGSARARGQSAPFSGAQMCDDRGEHGEMRRQSTGASFYWYLSF